MPVQQQNNISPLPASPGQMQASENKNLDPVLAQCWSNLAQARAQRPMLPEGLPTLQTQDDKPMLGQCWPSVEDNGQHQANTGLTPRKHLPQICYKFKSIFLFEYGSIFQLSRQCIVTWTIISCRQTCFDFLRCLNIEARGGTCVASYLWVEIHVQSAGGW